MEQRFSEAHYARIGAGRPESVDSSSLHLDVLRDLQRITSHVTSVAYPILEDAGEISTRRLRTPARAVDPAAPAPGAESRCRLPWNRCLTGCTWHAGQDRQNHPPPTTLTAETHKYTRQ